MQSGYFLLLALTCAPCPVTYSIPSDEKTLVQRGPSTYSPSTIRLNSPLLESISDSSWIWESNLDTTGPYTFVRTFKLVESALAALTSLKLSVFADDLFSVVFNGVLIEGEWKRGLDALSQYELKAYALGSSQGLGVRENRLEIPVKNGAGWVGLRFRLDFIV